jgi:hypothetical protein
MAAPKAHPSNLQNLTHLSAERPDSGTTKCVILSEGRSPESKDLQFAHSRAKGASFESPEDHSFIGGK